MCANPAAAATVEELHGHVERAKSQLRQAQESQKKFADRYRTPVTYVVGDKVFLRLGRAEQRAASLKNKYIGPLDVIAVPSEVNVQLALPVGVHPGTHDIFHVDRLKKYQASPDRFPTRVQNLRPGPDVIDGVEMYEVEDILGERTKSRAVKGRRRTEKQYLVKWKGYGTAEASWEPARTVDAPEVVARYRARQAQQNEEGNEPTSDEHKEKSDVDRAHPNEAKEDSHNDEQDSVD
jgi:Chromo (CHRromatin Organisation MOdifier) domain